MSQEQDFIKKRFLELAQRTYEKSVYTHTGFLSVAEQSVFSQLLSKLPPVPYQLMGGLPDAERKLLQFGSEDFCGYPQEPPICCLLLAPAGKKFAEPLTHRDYLGAIMNLGIERDTLGDLILADQSAYLFCTDAVSPFLQDNLTCVRHTVIRCGPAPQLPPSASPALKPQAVQIAGERLDSIVARVYRLSREESCELFRQKRVFVNSVLTENNSALPKAGDIVSVRGHGRFLYRGVTGLSKKGKRNVLIEKYQS